MLCPSHLRALTEQFPLNLQPRGQILHTGLYVGINVSAASLALSSDLSPHAHTHTRNRASLFLFTCMVYLVRCKRVIPI